MNDRVRVFDFIGGGSVHRCNSGVGSVVAESSGRREFSKVPLIFSYYMLESLGRGFERW